jgi:hypothetical protein
MFFRMLGVVIGGCLIASAAEATPQHDHELLVELASLELTRCQDELTKLRDFQSDNSEMKVMAVRAAAIAEAECKKLRDAIDAARAAILIRRSRKVVNSAFASGCGLGIASRRVSISQ